MNVASVIMEWRANMGRHIGNYLLGLGTAAAITACGSLYSQASAQTELPIATFPFPSVSNIIADVILAKGFDKANNLDAKPIVYGTGGALWAGLAKNVVDANNALAQAQLEANRVDAIMTWEPAATQILKKNPDVRVILKGDDAWKAVAGDAGWELDLVLRSDFMEKNPGALQRVIKMYKDAGDFIRTHPEEADAIVSSGKYASKGVEPGSIIAAIKADRLIYDVRPSWDPTANTQLWKMLDAGLKYGLIPALPEQAAIMNAAP
jgi:hypothetical protein